MTVICALCDATNRDVWLGCNDGVTVGDTRMPGAKREKWLLFNDWAIGTSGSSIPSEVLDQSRQHFPVDEDSPLAVTQFLKALFDEHELGFRDEENPLTSYPIVALMAHRNGRIWDLDSYLAIDELPPGTLWARGSSMDFALGADFPLASGKATSEERVRNAVEAAIFYDSGSPGQASVQKLGSKNLRLAT